MTNKKTAVLGICDLHTNGIMALCPPTVKRGNGEYIASREQRQLWEWYLDFCQWAKQITKGYRRIGFIGGDAAELDTKRRTYEIITPNKSEIQDLLIETVEPFVNILDGLIVIRGTPAHVGKSAWIEEWLAQDTTIAIKGEKTSSHYQYRGVADGVRFDIAHHASMGGLPWTEKQAATKAAAQAVMEYSLMGAEMPHVMIRAHNHRWSIDRDNYPIHVYCMASWTYPTEYTYRIGKYNGLSQIGGGVWLCEKGEYTWKKREYTLPKARRIWANSM